MLSTPKSIVQPLRSVCIHHVPIGEIIGKAKQPDHCYMIVTEATVKMSYKSASLRDCCKPVERMSIANYRKCLKTH